VKKKLLIVAAHPDDEILGCGGFISKYKTNYDFKVLFLAEGSSCRYKDLNADKEVIKEKILLRKEQATKALNFFSIKDIVFCDLPCGRLNTIPDVKKNHLIEEQINNFKPEVIFTHSSEDLHPDHRSVFSSVMQASRPVKNKFCVKEIYSFEILSSSEWSFTSQFKPNHFVKLDKKNLDEKWKAMQFYTEEIIEAPHPRSEFGLKTLANYRGIQSGTEFAEAFCKIRTFEI
jgi:LmbE family N-acetylglucosaminyl deacetylase